VSEDGAADLLARRTRTIRGWNDTHVGPVLPERAPSEGPCSTAALRPTWVSFQKRKTSKLGRVN
jgi:hypothetical protein